MFQPLRELALCGLVGIFCSASGLRAQEQVVIERLDDLARCTPSQLDALFLFGKVSAIPTGRMRGLPLVNAGKRGAILFSRGGRMAWSGKRIDADGQGAVNYFFGVPSVRANIRIEPSLRDGQPAIVLDYSQSSWVYRNVRDEIREVSPGLFLGYVDDSRTLEPIATRWFALEFVK